ncbi:MAG: hypothetical protein AAB358_01120 [Patescibacteria group bacterium]
MDWKKIGIIVLFVAAAGLFAFFLYWFFWRPIFAPRADKNANVNQPGQLPGAININGRIYTTNINGGLPPGVNLNNAAEVAEILTRPATQIVKAEVVTKDPAYFAAPTGVGEFVYYNPTDGKFYRVSANGAVSAFSDKIFKNVSNVTWSNSRDKAVLEYPDGAKIVYDFETKKQITLPKHWEEFSFSPNDSQIAFKSIALDPENRFLAVAKYDGTQSKTLEEIGGFEDQFQTEWSPNNQMVGTFTEGKDADRSNVYFIGQNNENFKLMLVEGRGFQSEWSPTGDKMVYSVYNSGNDFKPTLWVADTSPDRIGDNRHSLGLDTWADKCAFAGNNTVYCAVPTSLPYGAGVQPLVASTIADEIYEINLSTGMRRLVATPDGNHTISQIFVSDSSNEIFFQDMNNQRIYRIQP